MILVKTISRVEFDNSAYLLETVFNKYNSQEGVGDSGKLASLIHKQLTVLHKTDIRSGRQKNMYSLAHCDFILMKTPTVLFS